MVNYIQLNYNIDCLQLHTIILQYRLSTTCIQLHYNIDGQLHTIKLQYRLSTTTYNYITI